MSPIYLNPNAVLCATPYWRSIWNRSSLLVATDSSLRNVDSLRQNPVSKMTEYDSKTVADCDENQQWIEDEELRKDRPTSRRRKRQRDQTRLCFEERSHIVAIINKSIVDVAIQIKVYSC